MSSPTLQELIDQIKAQNVSQFGPIDSTVDSYKEAAEYAAEAKEYRDETQEIYNSLTDTVNVSTIIQEMNEIKTDTEQFSLDSKDFSEMSKESSESSKDSSVLSEQYKDLSLQYANTSKDYSEQTLNYKDQAEAIVENSNTFPDTTSGLSGTTEGQYFRVPQGTGPFSFIYYRNTLGAAVEVSRLVGQGSISNSVRTYKDISTAQNDIANGNILSGSLLFIVNNSDENLADEYINNGGTLEATGRRMISREYVDALIEVILQRISPLQESPDSLFDIASANGIRPFRVREDNKTEISEIVRLLTGDSGLEFSGNAVDNYAPDGWLFVIHSLNGLVIAGVKEDGTKVGWGGDSGGGGQCTD